eukprot:CAMPEP_0173427468 /NCGR_PEP_ID=MMETSP1357-20121228/6661_1 /TAXON_ID=77926 /ORGANISM="Hemiselmis rufescens, Strain PCC563" /LENGTH=176 /DNA_ID=CAMNT_0014391315 /DNA_START=24 /DNA_END=551 /DNA_ORIENTATION=-
MSGRPSSRGRMDVRPPSGQGMRPASPRIQLTPLQQPNKASVLLSESSDKEAITTLKKDIRRIASKLSDFSSALQVDARLQNKDASSLLRNPLNSAHPPRPPSGGGQAGPAALAANIETLIDRASAAPSGDGVKASLLELLFTVTEDAQRCAIALTDKKAPSRVHVPPPPSDFAASR